MLPFLARLQFPARKANANQMQNAKSIGMGNGKTSIAKQKSKKYKKRAGSKVEQNKMRKNARPLGWGCVWGRQEANLGAVKANTTLAAKKFHAFVFVSEFVRALLLWQYECASGCVCAWAKIPLLNFLHTIFCAFFRAHRRLQTSPIPNWVWVNVDGDCSLLLSTMPLLLSLFWRCSVRWLRRALRSCYGPRSIWIAPAATLPMQPNLFFLFFFLCVRLCVCVRGIFLSV